MNRWRHARREKGFSLIELMVTIIIGMLIVLAVLNLFLASTRTHKTTENLSRIQENARIAFELMAFDLRQAGGTPCGRLTKVANVINMSTAMPWFTTGVRGYDSSQSIAGTSADNRAGGTDALTYGLASSTGVAVENHEAGNAARFQLNTTAHGLIDGDVVMVCDNNLAAILQITTANDSTDTVTHNTGNTVSPGNCEKELVPDTTCANPTAIRGKGSPDECGVIEPDSYYEFCKNSVLVRYESALWFIGCNGRSACSTLGGRSLYKAQFPDAAQEVVPDVQDMQIQYMVAGGAEYVDASSIINWDAITAIRISLTLVGPDTGATTSSVKTQRLTRTVSHVVNLRNQ
jgi:type IV pilus assembly protein PilW